MSDTRTEAATRAMHGLVWPMTLAEAERMASKVLAAADAVEAREVETLAGIADEQITLANDALARLESVLAKNETLHEAIDAAVEMQAAFESQFSHHTLAGPTIQAILRFASACGAVSPTPQDAPK
jgi:hypothetical protein